MVLGEAQDKAVNKGIKELYEWLNAIIISMVVMFFFFTFIFRTITVSGMSMVPTLQDHDRLILLSAFYTPAERDIVVVTQPDHFSGSTDEPLIKRIIGLPGDEVDIDFTEGTVYINGEALVETYTNEPTHQRGTSPVDFPVTVPEGYVFVMGDNRNFSRDSRDNSVGMVDERYILGRAVCRIWPLDRARFFS